MSDEKDPLWMGDEFDELAAAAAAAFGDITDTQTTGAAQAPSSYLTPEVLDELARLESAATEGPWRSKPYPDGKSARAFGPIVVPHPQTEYGCKGFVLKVDIQTRNGEVEDWWLSIKPEDMALLTVLRNAAPALIAAARQSSLDRLTVEMAEAMREKWQADVAKAEAERDSAYRERDHYKKHRALISDALGGGDACEYVNDALAQIEKLKDERDAAVAENKRLKETLEEISEGCGMLNQPAALNGPEEEWLKRRIREYERRAWRALHPSPETIDD